LRAVGWAQLWHAPLTLAELRLPAEAKRFWFPAQAPLSRRKSFAAKVAMAVLRFANLLQN
jgi:hypothetical protein